MAAPFFRGLRRLDFRKIEEKSFTKLWALDCWFSHTNDQPVLYERRKYIAEGTISARGRTEAPALGAGRKAAGKRSAPRQLERETALLG